MFEQVVGVPQEGHSGLNIDIKTPRSHKNKIGTPPFNVHVVFLQKDHKQFQAPI